MSRGDDHPTPYDDLVQVTQDPNADVDHAVELVHARAEIQRLTKEMDAMRTQAKDTAEPRVDPAKLEAMNDDLSTRLHAAELELASARKQLAKSKQQQTETQASTKELDEALERLLAAEHALQEVEEAKISLEGKLSNAKKRQAKLAATNDDLSARLLEAQTHVDEEMIADRVNQALAEQRDQMNAMHAEELDALHQSHAAELAAAAPDLTQDEELERLRSHLHEAEQAVLEQEDELAELKTEMSTMQSVHQTTMDQLTSAHEQAVATMEQDHLDDLQVLDDEHEELSRSLRNEEVRITELNAEVKKLKSQLSRVIDQAAKDVADAVDDADRLRKELQKQKEQSIRRTKSPKRRSVRSAEDHLWDRAR